MRMRALAITAVLGVMHWAGAAMAQQSETVPQATEDAPATPAAGAGATEASAEAASPEAAVEPVVQPVAAEPAFPAPKPPPPSPSPPSPPSSAAVQLATPAAAPAAAAPAAQPAPPADDTDDDPMSTFGIGPKLGIMMPLAFARTNRYRVLKYDVTPSAAAIDRNAPVTSDTQTSRGGDVLFSLAVPINLGDGHGIALDLEPTIAFCMSCDESRGDYTYFGAYGGLALRFQPADPFYVSIGAGLRPGIALHDGVEFSAQGELRVPITFTYYVHHAVGLVFELAPGFGGYVDLLTNDAAEASMQADHAQGVFDGRSVTVPVVGSVPYDQVSPVSGSAEAVEFGFGASIDLSIGLRFP